MPEEIPYSTSQVSAEKTAAEIEEMLRKHGCQTIGKEYESERIKMIYFQIATADGTMPFKLPVNVGPIDTLMITEKTTMRKYAHFVPTDTMAKVYAQAERTAWRIIAWWLKSQLALIQLGMVSTVEVFLPYMLVDEKQTFFEQLQSTGFKSLMLMPSPIVGVIDEDAN